MKIDKVSSTLGLTKDTLRYYEKIGLIKEVKKNPSGIREYDEENIEHIKFILCMRNAGLTLKQIKHYIELFEQGDSTHDERLEILHTQKKYVSEQIKALEETYAFLENKIEIYNSHVISDK